MRRASTPTGYEPPKRVVQRGDICPGSWITVKTRLTSTTTPSNGRTFAEDDPRVFESIKSTSSGYQIMVASVTHVTSTIRSMKKFDRRDPESFCEWRHRTLAVIELRRPKGLDVVDGEPRAVSIFAQTQDTAASKATPSP